LFINYSDSVDNLFMKTWSAIVLSGGTNRRFGSDKSAALLHGVSLLDHVLSFIPKEIKTVVVGKDVFEEPPLGGPVAGIARGLQEIDTEFVAVAAVDMPYGSALFSQLLNSISADAAMPIDADGFKQPLCGIYRRVALLSAIEKLGNPHGQSMRALCELLAIDEVQVDARALIDIDTPEDLISAHSSPRLTGL
jgi:molybdopterin-guanine dinucleotide biosynthesis protein A